MMSKDLWSLVVLRYVSYGTKCRHQLEDRRILQYLYLKRKNIIRQDSIDKALYFSVPY